MKSFLIYLLEVTIISGLLYGYYHMFLRNRKFHHYNRYYLLSATALSLIIPLLNIPLYVSQPEAAFPVVLQTLTDLSSSTPEAGALTAIASETETSYFNWLSILRFILLSIGLLVFLRVLFSLFRIHKLVMNNPAEKIDSIHFINTSEPGTPYSFFRWLFWNRDIDPSCEKGNQIFRHELFHIRQNHSLDIIAMELIFIPFYLNPFFYLIKKELRAIHEFLADRFAVSGNDQWKYAEMLLMHTLNTRQALVNPFFQNQIKRRIAMITNSTKPSYQYIRKILVIPIAVATIILFAFTYKYKHNDSTLPALNNKLTVIIDAGHGGDDRGAVATDGTAEKDITLSIANKIKSLNDDNNLNIFLTRNDDAKPSLKSRTELSKNEKADLFISIHIGSYPDKNKSCFEILVPGGSKEHSKESNKLASVLMGQMKRNYHTEVKTSHLKNSIWVLENNHCPSTLLECGNFNNAKDLAFIKDRVNQEKIAERILAAIHEYAEQKDRHSFYEMNINEEDTLRKKLILKQNPNGTYGGNYDGLKIKENFTQSNGSLILMLENKEMIVLSKELSLTIFKKKGYDMTILVNKDQATKIDPSKIKWDADSKSGTSGID